MRALLRARRAARSGAARLAVARGLRDVFLDLPFARHAKVVAVYVSGPDEPGTEILRASLVARGVIVLLLGPECGEGRRWNQPALPSNVDVVVVPALAVDTLGRRLAPMAIGYERLFLDLPPATPVLAAVHDDEIYDIALGHLPGAREEALVGALTPTRFLPFTHAQAPATGLRLVCAGEPVCPGRAVRA